MPARPSIDRASAAELRAPGFVCDVDRARRLLGFDADPRDGFKPPRDATGSTSGYSKLRPRMLSVSRTVRSIAARVGPAAALVRAERRPYAAGLVFVAVSIGTALTYPQVIRLIIDDAIGGGHLDRLNRLALMMLGILLIEGIATCLRDYYFNLGAERIASRVRRESFRRLLAEEISFFDTRNTGALTTRLWSDVAVLQDLLGEPLADAIRFGLFALCGTALLLHTSPALTVLILLAVPPIVGATVVLGRRVKALAARVQARYAEAGVTAEEAIAGIRTVRAFSQEAAETARYDAQMTGALELARQKILSASVLGGLSFVAGECAALLALWAGGNMIVRGHLTSGTLISFVLYAFLVARGFRNASRFTAESLRALGATSWIFDVLARDAASRPEGGLRPADADGSIVLEGVAFHYPARPEAQALNGISLRIAPGETVAVVGKSGAGKSTLVNLLLRFYDADEGRVLVGGRDVRDLDRTWLRQHVVAVLQDSALFSRSVAENIRYGRADASDEDVAAAAALACADRFIDRLRDGYATPVGDRGVQLSGGQRQRLAIARAILRQPAVLVLDEATSALDAELESVVQMALRTLPYRPTTVIIAHRLSTVTHVDRVVVLDEGRIVETGRHDELLERCGFYRQLVETQLVAQ